VHTAATGLEGTNFLPIIGRVKAASTRQSVAQVRRRIAEAEYRIDESVASLLAGRRVFVLDDNVTTGTTMLHAATLLRRLGPAAIVPVAIERHVSARVLQRCPSTPEALCRSYAPRAM
jgi:predicted amidophosphoribosyltransferase